MELDSKELEALEELIPDKVLLLTTNDIINHIKDLQQRIDKLQKQNDYLIDSIEKYTDKIDIAITFIENRLEMKDKTIYEDNARWLLSILRGEDNERV